jgi:DNA-binding MarR family transcriptional regulator
MSNESRDTLIAAVAREIAEFQSASEVVDEAAAQRMGINRTDLRCLGLLFGRGPLNAGQVASESGLSPAATTAALDRLERAGYARRVRDPADRRGVLVELTALAHQRLQEIYGPVGRAGMARLAGYSDAELALLRDFLCEGRRFQIEQAARIRGERMASKRGGRTGWGRRRGRRDVDVDVDVDEGEGES